ncbi:comF family protein [Chitinophaga jiangningensis]|uniref:ComF family protein n=1 Tax=Chitinophaga jiangningensis TaxID=1419482 RepID=A0A1M7HZG2_9BACT|nr:phosphoribosyltransferase family protein [Chitinophaga jiangningensis]SHM33936.1 comF family protein [Chitinophaga jiangningensis]
MITRLLTPLVDLFYPHCCAVCGTDLDLQSDKICIACEAVLPATQFHLFPDNPIEKIFWGRTKIAHAMAAYYYSQSSGIQQLIHQFKYKNRKDLAIYLGRKTGLMLIQTSWLYEIDAVIPVPLYHKKEKQRGYNQAQLLAAGIAEITGKPLDTSLLKRETYTNTQTRKGRVGRWSNVSTVFRATPAVQGMHLLLVDDVITTGATTEACSQALVNAGATVSIACLAYAWS